MHIRIQNFGTIQSADFEVKDLTVFVGDNGCGKALLNQTLYRFCDTLTVNLLQENAHNTLLDIQRCIQKVHKNMLADGEYDEEWYSPLIEHSILNRLEEAQKLAKQANSKAFISSLKEQLPDLKS